MWEFTSGIPPFGDEEHDIHLSLSICEGDRPKIIENTPKCFIDLMKKCWDSDPENRPTITKLEKKISEWIRCVNEYYALNKDGSYGFAVPGIDSELENDMLEFVEANNALVQEQTNISSENDMLESSNDLVQDQTNISSIQSYSQAYSTSHKSTEIYVKAVSDYLDCMI
ncbi:kinase-like domain-containing protein [Rhizophagus clarus]|nr:kinase-like domain-containing protein [Rhizophagus clarus]